MQVSRVGDLPTGIIDPHITATLHRKKKKKRKKNLALLHSERPKLYTTLAFLSAIGLNLNKVIVPCLDRTTLYM